MKMLNRVTVLAFAVSALFSAANGVLAQTVIWSENFDDGNGNNRWYADNGVWQIGSPTVGPQTNAVGARSFSGTNCVTTGLNGNYLASQDSRFIRIASFTVPASNNYPRLRFEQWFNFAGSYCYGGCDEGSYGYVEIKAGTNNWVQVSPTYSGYCSGVWSQPSIDLSAYAGQTVKVAFHFHSAHNTSTGWYIDDVAVVTGTPVFNNPEGFELGMGDWSAERGTWEVGVPTSGPGSAHGGTNCAATVLAGNYGSGVDSRLISPVFTVPASNNYPRLRFWHWFNFAGPYCYGGCDEGSYGYVEIKAGTNNWQTVSPQNYSGNSSGVWTQPSIDLTAYAGQTVQVAFHFHSANNTSTGWYVDDVAVVTGTPVFNNPEGFELGMGDWSVERGTWEIGVPTSGPTTNALGSRAHSGTNCAATVLAGNYGSGVDSRLISPVFTVPASNNYPRLRFWHWFNFAGPYCYGGCDEGSYGYVEIKAGTNNWQTVSPQNYSGNSSGVWTWPSIDLTAYAGQTVQVAFHFHSANNTSTGWYIDDVAVVTGTPVFNNPEGFELGMGDWSVERGTWEIGVPTSGPTTNALGWRAHSGTNCAATVLAGNYGSGVDSRLVSPAFTVPPSADSPYLRFWHWYNFAGPYCYGGCDEGSYGYVEIKVGTNAWQSLSSQYTGQSGAWTEPLFDLTPYGGQLAQLAFHFHSAYYVAPGWYVDDIGVYSSGAPVIITPPASQTNFVGNTATFTVSASGDQPLSYQWRYNFKRITGATNTTLTLPNVQLSQSGYYDVIVTNDAGSVTSTPRALLTVLINWTGVAVNDSGETGSFTNVNGTITVQGMGEGTDGTADIFYYAYQPLTGDAQIIARLKSLQGGDPQMAEAGIMMRQSLDPGTLQVSLSVDESTNVIFRRRLANDNYTVDDSFDGVDYFHGTNIWLRLMRMGNTFVGHYSTDGVNWQYMWFTSVTMTNPVDVGLAVTSHHYGETATAIFDNVTLGSLTPLSGVWPLPGPELLLGGEYWSPAEFQRVGGFEFLLGGNVGDYFSILSSTNMTTPIASWRSLGTVTNTYGVLPFIDSSALTNKALFYRAKRLGP